MKFNQVGLSFVHLSDKSGDWLKVGHFSAKSQQNMQISKKDTNKLALHEPATSPFTISYHTVSYHFRFERDSYSYFTVQWMQYTEVKLMSIA